MFDCLSVRFPNVRLYFGVSSIKFDYRTQTKSIERSEFDWVRLPNVRLTTPGTCTQFLHSLVTLIGRHLNYDKYVILVRLFLKSKPLTNIISVLNSNLFCKRAILINRNYILEIPVCYINLTKVETFLPDVVGCSLLIL